ncbi:hypothetical protein [Octadecabacter antarcticus]|uniref:hypothetical protein n=1 Tax=Octadecabacter antarcticus TaxID=1217908 RepID=UPI000302E3D8|nr:hypothetical protein [Octadecabacter antarcticus]
MRDQPDLQSLASWVAAFGITPDTRMSMPFGAPSERKHYTVFIAQGALGFGLPYADLNVGP